MRAIFMATSVVVLTALAGCSKSETKTAPQGEAKPGTEAQATTGGGQVGGDAQAGGEAKPESDAKAAGEAEPESVAQAEAALPIPEESRKLFAERCATCHGAEGKGDGAASAALTPKPRNYHDAEWQKSVTNQYLADITVKGGAGVGKSPMMPPNPDLADKPEVVNGIVALIRSFGKE